VPIDAAAKPNDDRGKHLPVPVVEIGEAMEPRPFAWQVGRRLWILDSGCADWVHAELEFEPQSCRYHEIRRSTYRWPREAAGALLGRTYVGGQRRVEAAARSLSEWVTQVESTR
jgi:hypothetical protein